MKRARVLVLGASGRIGRLLRRCWGDGNAYALAPTWQYRTAASAPGGAAEILLPDYRSISAAVLAEIQDMDAILVLAGVTPSAGVADTMFDVNRDLALAAIDIAEAAGIARVFLCSTAAVYGSAACGQGRLDEAGPATPVSAYGRAKLAMEEAAQKRVSDVSISSLRIANVAGADQLLGPGRRQVTLDVFDNGQTPWRSYLGPETFACILADLLHSPQPLPACLNVTTADPVEMAALLQAAGIDFLEQAAPAEALERVDLDSRRLAALVPLSATDSQPEEIVRQWLAITGGQAL